MAFVLKGQISYPPFKIPTKKVAIEHTKRTVPPQRVVSLCQSTKNPSVINQMPPLQNKAILEISSRFLAASYRKTEWLVKKWQHFCPLASHISALTNTQFFMVRYGRLRGYHTEKTKELLVIFSLPTSAEVVSIERLLGEKEGIWYSRSVFFSSDVLALLDYNSATKI